MTGQVFDISVAIGIPLVCFALAVFIWVGIARHVRRVTKSRTTVDPRFADVIRELHRLEHNGLVAGRLIALLFVLEALIMMFGLTIPTLHRYGWW